MIHLNTSSSQSEKYILSPSEVMAIKIFQHDEISGGGKNDGEEGENSTIC